MTRYIRYSLDLNVPPTLTDHAGSRYGLLDGDRVTPIRSLFDNEPHGDELRLEELRVLPSVCPTKIVCVGRNYARHAKELGNEVPQEPLIFLKPPSSLNAHHDPILYPRLTQNLNYEGEVGLIIGKRARHIAADGWRDYVWGYTCVNDVTARDLQKKDGQWTRGKGFDTFCPVGQWSVPASEVDFASLRVRTLLDGNVVQEAPVTDMIFGPGAILAFVTQFLTLEPGDLIATGTPEGVGPMQVGNVVRVEVDGVGYIENPIIAE
jgi:2-keto-4-pentenoate hydratase/2-oxohepta-3-ene-1,7-dioic acid hydratase in catechol pathway